MRMMIKKGLNNLSDLDFQTGQVILIDKPLGWTSFKVVYQIRKASGAKKVGHAGTLDPLATGLLILATGKKTKEISEFQGYDKTYSGTIILGRTSPSMDMETEPDNFSPVTGISEEDIYNTRDEFLGKIQQIPPMFSAIKFGGKTMYNLARKGKVVELAPREIEIKSFEITGINIPEVSFEIICSKGTYIRSIADDFGRKLGCGGVLGSLRRLKIGNYSVNEAFTMSEILPLFNKSSISAV
jgi:tRNA pseudouridine55 synthase